MARCSQRMLGHDFVHDRLADGRAVFPLLTLVEVSPAIECDFSSNGQRVVAVMERLKENGLPQTIKVDNGSVSSQGARRLGASSWREDRVQPARQAYRQCFH
jgi:hypothetical protein